MKKSAATDLFAAIQRVLAGRHYVTPLITHDPTMRFVSRAQHGRGAHGVSLRQREVLQLLICGYAAFVQTVIPPRRHHGQDGGTAPKRRWAIWFAGGVALVATIVVVVAPRSASAQSAQSQPLVGRWLRPDGGYVLEIRTARADGHLEAAYFNPRSIHVAQANYRREGGDVAGFVEFVAHRLLPDQAGGGVRGGGLPRPVVLD